MSKTIVITGSTDGIGKLTALKLAKQQHKIYVHGRNKAKLKEVISELKEAYYKEVSEVLKEATLTIPENPYFQKGGKQGIHTEHMGYILADLQYMQRTYPNMTW